MKIKTAPENATSEGQMQALRRQAEKVVRNKAGKVPENLTSLSAADAQRVLHDLQVHQIELELQNEELRQTQGALEASRARYFDLYDLAPAGYFTLDENGVILEANLTAATLLGVARGALVRQPFSRFIVGDNADKYYLRRKQLVTTGAPQGFELCLSRKDGAPFTAWLEASVAPDDGGAPAACRVVISDITERKAIEEKLRQGQSLLHTAGTIAQVGGWALQLPHNDLTWSDEICAILDFPKGTVPLLAEALALYPPASFEIILGALKSCFRDGTPFDCELEIFTAKRRRLDVRAIGQAVRDASGRITGIEGALQDITEHKRAYETRAMLSAIVESSEDAIIGKDLDGVITSWNNGAERIFGYTAREAVGQPSTRLFPSEKADEEAVILECLRRGEVIENYETVRRRKDGTVFDASVAASPIRDKQGRVVGASKITRDITERKNAERMRASLEAQLRESQKMEAIGTLAGGIAHDFNNILGTILGNAELARQDARANWQALVSLEEIQKAGHRARDLVQQILTFGRRQPTSRRVMALPAVVEESVRLLRATLPGAVRIECHCAADTPSVTADPTQIQQVLLNLGTNAAHAMEGRTGIIDIRVEGITLDEAATRFDLNLRPGRYARVVVSDTGHGMDAATQRRIFEPFFTTKPAGQGTGLGLSVAYGIVQAHEGVIVVHSEPGRGSRFELYFPRASQVAAATTVTEQADPVSEGRGQHILYIDDDEAQVFLIKRTLERWGYRVSAFLEQREALDALLAGVQQFDLVLTDFNMPGLSGLEVARAIRNAQPDLPVIVVSGFVSDEMRAQVEAAGVREVISKAHEVEELRDAVQRLVKPRERIKPDPA